MEYQKLHCTHIQLSSFMSICQADQEQPISYLMDNKSNDSSHMDEMYYQEDQDDDSLSS